MNKKRQNIVVFTGAGVSAESGISTFRDKDGLWTNYDAMKLASIDGFRDDPEAVLDFYNDRRWQLFDAKPNHAHYALAELEKIHDVTIITQNVDDLHERAGHRASGGLRGQRSVYPGLPEAQPDNAERVQTQISGGQIMIDMNLIYVGS